MHPMPKAPAPAPMPADAAHPTLDVARPAGLQSHPADVSRVGESRHANSIMERAGAVVLAISSARTVSDQELRQHAMDCAWLMEQAYVRFEEHGDPACREEAVRWMDQRRVALQALSPEWKAAHEAQIQQAIGQDYFFGAQRGGRG